MQIATIHKLQYALDTVIKVLKFAVRHVLVLTLLTVMVWGVCNGGTLEFLKTFSFLYFAAFFDKIKMDWRTPNPEGTVIRHLEYPTSAFESSFMDRNDWNPHIVGSSAYLRNH
jgi:hypothetical protein